MPPRRSACRRPVSSAIAQPCEKPISTMRSLATPRSTSRAMSASIATREASSPSASSRAPRSAAREDAEGLEASRIAIEALIAREVERGVASERIVLMGFSQGCAMALLTGLRHAQPLGGIVGLSGYLPLAPQTLAARSAAAASLPIFLAHGTRDGVLPLAWGRDARQQLEAAGHPVAWHEYAMEHSVCQEEIADLERWLLATLR